MISSDGGLALKQHQIAAKLGNRKMNREDLIETDRLEIGGIELLVCV